MSGPILTVLLGDPSLPDRTKPGGRFTANDFDQVRRLKGALEQIEDFTFRYIDDHERLLELLQSARPERVLNFCDTGYRNEARHELHVAAFLEGLGIPYSGSGPVALGLCHDKALVSLVARSLDVPVPVERLVRCGGELPDVGYPAFIKPNRGDGSLGITADSIVHDAVGGRQTLERLQRELPGTEILVQEFLAGAEYGVGVIGNPDDRFTVLPVLEVDYGALDPSLPRLLDYGSKTDPDSPYWKNVGFRRADLGAPDLGRISGWCRALFERLELRDYARFDFRAGARGEIKLMEVNPNPAWCWDGKLAHMAALLGESHSDLLRRIIDAAIRRWGV
ncbi:MAG TPA: D-alanine--D-alanine ligase [Candidatus Polarisedimenticolia bacterium]|nr:D-alanine--D-alanine ligase [Candidatus Polarisedimenticolia bacterium]